MCGQYQNSKICLFNFLNLLYKNKLTVINHNHHMCMELLTYLPLGLIIDVSTCMDNITFKIRLQYGSYQFKLLHMHDSSRV